MTSYFQCCWLIDKSADARASKRDGTIDPPAPKLSRESKRIAKPIGRLGYKARNLAVLVWHLPHLINRRYLAT